MQQGAYDPGRYPVDGPSGRSGRAAATMRGVRRRSLLAAGFAGILGLQGTALGQPVVVDACPPDGATNPLPNLTEISRVASAGGATLPACASPLARAVFEGATRHLDGGTTAPALFASGANAADPDVLMTSREVFPRMAEMIEHAKSEVLFQTYIWQDGDGSRALLEGMRRLEQRRKAEAAPGAKPVTIRILASAIDYPAAKWFEPAAGVLLPKIAGAVEALGLDPRYVRVEVGGYLHKSVGSLHTKTLVVDGRTAMLTGVNLQRQQDYDHPWHDAGFLLEGDIGAVLRDDFASAWRNAGLWTCGGRNPPGPSTDCLARTPMLPRLPRRSVPGACVPMMILSRAGDGNPFTNRTDSTKAAGFLAAFRNAERTIRIHTPNLNDDAVRRALVAAVQRGVQVEVVLSKEFNERAENLVGQGGGNEENVELLRRMLVEAGVENPCERLQVRWYSEDGRRPVVGNGPGAAHTKYTSVDDQIAIVGSSNMDTQSWNHSREVNVLVDDPATVRAWDDRLFKESWDRAIPACD